MRLLEETCEEHSKTYDENTIREFMDMCVKEIRKQEFQKINNSSFTVDQMVALFLDLFVAGSETSSTAIQWAILYIFNFPEIKFKLQTEIDKVVLLADFPA